jgi:hypothetical protein
MNWKGFGRKRSWPNFKVLSRNSLEGLRKTVKILIRIAGCRGQKSNTGPPEYEAVVLTTQLRRPVRVCKDALVMYLTRRTWLVSCISEIYSCVTSRIPVPMAPRSEAKALIA